MPTITLARQMGVGGEVIATQVAGRLRLRLIDRDYLNHAARAAGLTDAALLEVEWPGQRNVIARVVGALRNRQAGPEETRSEALLPAPGDDDDDPEPERPTAWRVPPLQPLDGIFSPVTRPAGLGLSDSLQHLGRLMHRLAAGGDCLFVGRGSQMWLRDRPGALHVLVIAPLHQRIARVEERTGVNHKTAQQQVRSSDRARADYMRRYHGVDWLDANLYDLVINTDRLPTSLAVEYIIAAARKLAVESRTSTSAYQRYTPQTEEAPDAGQTSLLTGAQTENGAKDL